MLVSINIQDVQDMSAHCPIHISDTSCMYQLKPVSHRQVHCKDSVRTCHDQEFRSNNSFNS